MERIINGLHYDTDNATEITSWSNSNHADDFYFCSETLYRTDKGRWFLLGKGGARSKYSTPVAGGTSGGQEIIDLSEEEAYLWCENKNQIDTIKKHFSHWIEEA